MLMRLINDINAYEDDCNERRLCASNEDINFVVAFRE